MSTRGTWRRVSIRAGRQLFEGYKWATCGRDLQPTVASHVHLVKPGALTTLCGATANMSSIWRADPYKKMHAECQRLAYELRLKESHK